MTETERKLGNLAARAKEVAQAVKAYQRALLEARQAGASWQRIGYAVGCSKGAVRSQHRATAEHGGEMHLRLEPMKEGL